MKWDDLHFVLAVEREGGLAGASRLLGVSYSTAHRHLSQIERGLKLRIFDRRSDGYHVTSMAKEIVDTAMRMEVEALELERRVLGADKTLSGTIRVSTSELMGLYVLPPMFRRFSEQFPKVVVDVLFTDSMVNLKRSEADVVIRGTATPPPYLSGLDMGPVLYAAYVRKDLWNRSRPLHAYEWVGSAKKDPRSPVQRWLHSVVPNADCRYRFDSAGAVREAAIAGLGAAVLPCVVGDTHTNLTRISTVRHEPEYNIWLLTHKDLRKSARVNSFLRFMQAELSMFLNSLPAARA